MHTHSWCYEEFASINLNHFNRTEDSFSTTGDLHITRGMHDIVQRVWANTHTEQGTVACTDGYQNVTETSGHRIWHKKYKDMHNSRIVSSVKKSSTVYMVCCTGSTSCTLQDTCTTWCSLHWDSMHFRHLFRHALAPIASDFNTQTVSEATIQVTAPSRR